LKWTSPSALTGRRFVTTPAYVPNKSGWDTNGFTLAAVPHSKSLWLFGSYTPLTPHARLIGVIGTLR
jgi:hypothetical protein